MNKQQNNQPSVSEKWRTAGNARFQKIQEGNFKSINSDHINFCINQYDQALRTAENVSECYKASKNLGLTYEKRILIVDLTMIEKNTQELNNYVFCLTMMAKNYDLAFKYGKQAIKQEQYTELQDKVKKTFSKHFNILMEINQPTHIYKVIQYFTVIPQLVFYFYANVARFYFNEGFKWFEIEEFVKSKGFILESKNIIETHFTKSNKPKMDSETKKNFQDILESDNFYLKRITINLYLQRGLECYSKGIFENETIILDEVYMALSYFREAIKVCKYYEESNSNGGDNKINLDLEQEAICHAHLGHILYKLCKNVSKSKRTEETINEKASDYLSNAINLANSLAPKDFSKEKWYIFSKEDMEEIKKDELRKEEGINKARERIKKENQKIFDEIAKLAPLDHSKKPVIKFIVFILKNHPYKGYVPIEKLEDAIEEDMKKFIRKLSLGYHPDKYPKETEEEIKQYFIIEEISKIINGLYDLFKARSENNNKKEKSFERADTSSSSKNEGYDTRRTTEANQP